MRFTLAISCFAAAVSVGAGFVPKNPEFGISSALFSTVKSRPTSVKVKPVIHERNVDDPAKPSTKGKVTAEEINRRLETTLKRLSMKDATSPKLSKDELTIVYEDDHIVVVDKPSGLLSVKGKSAGGSLAQAVYEAVGCEMQGKNPADRMVVHRLGMDTSGLMVLAKTKEAVRGMNTVFRTRSIERKYEALVVGHVEKDKGVIDLPLMRDYESPPFMRISTDEHQRALIGLDPEEVGKKLLEAPKDSLTKYEVVSREELDGQPVTRLRLTSVSGRTHQLNCHLAAFGHPIVGDYTYGIDGIAVPNGGLKDDELPENPNRASVELQKAANKAADGKVCIHAKSLKFQHPITKEEKYFSTDAPF